MNKPTVDILIPTYNESEQIIESINTLLRFCEKKLQNYDYKIIVGDNASTDDTYNLVRESFANNSLVSAEHIEEKGRGRAIMKIWGDSKADICAYMDADLSTDLKHLPQLLDSISVDKNDIAIGSRHLNDSDVKRGFKRRFVGYVHVVLMKVILGVSFSDTYCGFKAASRSAIDTVFPSIYPNNWPVNGNAWFWDTEFLVLAQRKGLKISEIPVKWIDDPTTTAKLLRDAIESLSGMWRLRG
ncbi:glycosyltransferase [Candidatus Dojkabacteria bacterium]|uniref:Glycosyltransferase n=1 Tax=Candidatus Dojkabacteria bacterium TaxID=2099670 RepID=A0A955KV73_9BACT|nr:glycosyltransferase [Candidatus Dojkabacteria bacterium]